MLKELYIENLAVIEKASINFDDKFNVFSGETGAGKSILIGGINAILGSRVYKDIVREGAEKATVSALFSNISSKTKELIESYGYVYEDDELLLTREISSDGKSVARISGRIATAQVLKEIASELVDIHGQHDSRMLMDNSVHREMIDEFGKYDDKICEYKKHFKEFSSVSRALKKLESEENKREDKIYILNQKIDELKILGLRKNEETEIINELELLKGAEEKAESYGFVVKSLLGSDEDTGVIESLIQCSKKLQLNNELVISEKINGILETLSEIATELEHKIPTEETLARLSFLEERLSEINRISRKMGISADSIVERLEEWENELAELEMAAADIESLKIEKKKLGDIVKNEAAELSRMRAETGKKLAEEICSELKYLDMPDAVLLFEVLQDKVTINGMDEVELLISVNKGEPPKPIRKIASGGELSRIMLAIKCVQSGNGGIATMIFDEIDTGISGRAAGKVGQKLAMLSQKCQVLSVTHLAQIAAFGTNHLLIEKTTDENRTYTNVKKLDYEGRKHEIARIISGDETNIPSLINAETMLCEAEKYFK